MLRLVGDFGGLDAADLARALPRRIRAGGGVEHHRHALHAGGGISDCGRNAKVAVTFDPMTAVRGADCVVTDTWVSMGQEHRARGHNIFMPYQVNERLMGLAAPDALFMHCLPAHRGEEVSAEVIDGPQSVVWDEAENRMHVQKALMEYLLLGRLG